MKAGEDENDSTFTGGDGEKLGKQRSSNHPLG